MPVASDVLMRKVIETICKDDGFLIASSEAAAAAKCANTLLQWILDNQQSETHLKFCNDLVKLLMQSLPSASKLSKRERAKLWGKLFELQVSPEFTKLWEDFFHTSNIEGNVLFYQHVSDLVAESIIQTHYKIPQITVLEVHTTVTLTYQENNALRYAAEYIPRALEKQLRKSAHSLKEKLIARLEELVLSDPTQDTSADCSTD